MPRLLVGAAAGLVATATLVGVSPRPAAAQSAPANLSDQQLAGQRVIYSYTGLTPPASLLDQIRAGQAAGVIFFSDNISSPAQIASVTAELQQAAAQSPVPEPLLLMTDQEGGQVRRLPGAPALSERQIGASSDPVSLASQAGRGAGVTLASAGMNVNLAPVLGVYRHPGDFLDQYQRSYSTDPSTVAQAGGAFIRAQQATGVAATAKHFPGLGAAAANQNTDAVPVTLNVPLSTLRSVDEAPYRAAIDAGTRLVMVSWATYPALDPNRPAGLSPTVVQQELRGRLGFTGVTMTDALEAGALGAYGTTAHRATLAAGAGMDLILCASQNVAQGVQATDGLAAALGSGQLDRATFQASVQRVMALRQGMGQPAGAATATSPQFGVPGQTDVFSVANNGAVQVRWVDGAGPWHGPMAVSPPGLAPPGSPLAVARQSGVPDQTDVFVVGRDGATHVVWAQGGGPWRGPLAITPPGTAPPGAHLAASPQFGLPDQTDVFVVDTGGATRVSWVQGAGRWRGPLAITPPGTAPAGAGLAAANQAGLPDQTDVFAVDSAGATRVSWVQGAGGWQGPLAITPPGTTPPGAHLAVSSQFGLPHQTDVVAVGEAGSSQVSWVDGGGPWQGPLAITPPGTAPAGAGIAAANQAGLPDQTDVFAVDRTGATQVSWVQGAGGWQGP
ncbi:MAG TPA: glycoside hydrolase family 3 N-terminal domain-containing protein, partial [Acidimicrobiales bacterium]|nr:glycoside hydrolase family 3 N-terminal domain-containing protein [Acidimicrobiales bacterium]